MNKRILITGGCGFVGSNLSLLIKQKYRDYNVIAFDNLKRRGSELNINRLHSSGVEFIHGDLRIYEDIEQAGEIDLLIEAAAEPSVLAGFNSSLNYLIETNFIGSMNCLNYSLKHKADFIYLSTSRVYPINKIEGIKYQETENRFIIDKHQHIEGVTEKGISEIFPLDGARSFYGSSKLCSEIMIKEYNELYGLKTVVNRCGVITGPWQMGKVDQGVIVLWLAKHYFKSKLAYFGYGGEGKQVRDILHINDLFELIEYQMHNMDKVNGETFNAGGGKEISVSLKELTSLCEEITGNKIEIDNVKDTRVADIRIYITDNTKVTKATGWEPKKSVKEILKDIYEWIKSNERQLEKILN